VLAGGISGRLETAVLVTFAALPGASTAYILARQLGGDAHADGD
jgi:malonate transporter